MWASSACSSSKLSIRSADPKAAVKREMLTVRGDLWLSGSMGRLGHTLGQYTGLGNPGGGLGGVGDKPKIWLKVGVLGREKPGDRNCSDLWELFVEESGVASLELVLLFLFFLGVVGSVFGDSSGERSLYGGPISFCDNFLPAMLWVSNVAYKSWTTVALKCILPAGAPSWMH